MSIQKITIPMWRPPSLNQYIGKHWSIGYNLKNECKQLVLAYSRHIPQATTKRSVQMHVVLGKGMREHDADNTQKLILDGLVHAGMLVDDSPKWVEFLGVTYERGVHQTIITLEDLTE